MSDKMIPLVGKLRNEFPHIPIPVTRFNSGDTGGHVYHLRKIGLQNYQATKRFVHTFWPDNIVTRDKPCHCDSGYKGTCSCVW